MEQRGCNQSQPVANATASKTAQTREKRHALRPVADRSVWQGGSGRTDEFSVACRSPLRVCPLQGEMRPEQAAEKGVVR